MTQSDVSSIIATLDAMRGDLHRLEAKVDKTNGRVTELERQEIRQVATDAAKNGLKGTIWRASLAIVAAFTAIAGVLVAALNN